ncbi:MAG: RNA-binding protein [Prevotellaceae bacterium]|nr:RNA-binding protein [Prevotellaceae bacterium]MDY3856802.1 RNA-binding protein [Bacteroidaceae bacterium]
MNIFVSNLNYQATDSDLQQLFAQYGEVTSAKVIVNKLNGRSRGYGFVEMATEDEGNKAIEALAGQEFQGRTLNVAPAKSSGAKDTTTEPAAAE